MEKGSFANINWKQEFPEVPECVHHAIVSANEIILAKEKKKKKRFSRRGILVLAACLTLFSGMTVFAAAKLWQQRMEEMNQQELEAYFISIAESGAPSFRYSRVMTAEEKELFEQLEIAYEEAGVFPQGCVTMLPMGNSSMGSVSPGEAYKGKDVSYAPESGTFFLPEELTEEQLLQIIDFYHKADYSIQKVAKQVETGEIEYPTVGKTTTEAVQEFEMMEEFALLNEAVSYLEVILQEEYAQQIAVGNGYLYMCLKNQIKRIGMGTEEAEVFYHFPENQNVLAMDADKKNNVYVSVREYVEGADSYVNRLVKLDADGTLITEYDVKTAGLSEEEHLNTTLAYKMRETEDGILYVKARWGKDLLLYVFGKDGGYLGTVQDASLKVHPAGDMCLGEDGMLYVLGEEKLIKVDTENRRVAETFPYTSEEMITEISLLHSMDEDSFYLFSYDGLFVTNLGEGTSHRILAPHESTVFAEGCRSYPISENMMVAVNYWETGIKLTYLRIEQ